jgi:hypothetical protein
MLIIYKALREERVQQTREDMFCGVRAVGCETHLVQMTELNFKQESIWCTLHKSFC